MMTIVMTGVESVDNGDSCGKSNGDDRLVLGGEERASRGGVK